MGIKKKVRSPSMPGLAIEIPLHVMNTWIGLLDNQALNLIGSCQSQKKTDAVGDDLSVKLERRSRSLFVIMFDEVKTTAQSSYTVTLPDVMDSTCGSGDVALEQLPSDAAHIKADSKKRPNLAESRTKRSRKRTKKATLDEQGDTCQGDPVHVLRNPPDNSQGLLESMHSDTVSALSSQATVPCVEVSTDSVKHETGDPGDDKLTDVKDELIIHGDAEKNLNIEPNIEIHVQSLLEPLPVKRKPARKVKPKKERVPRKPGRRQDKHCIYCGDTFRAVSTRIFHEKYKCIDNPARRRVYYCTACSKKFLDVAEFDQHRVEHAKEDFKLVCTDCGKIYRTRPGLYMHKLNKHSDVEPRFKCEVCDKEFYRKVHLHNHMIVHTESRPCQCEVCGKRFKDRSAVIKHRKTVHEDTYPYRCDKCGHGMDKLKYLQAHQCGRVRRNPNLKPENYMHKRKKPASKSKQGNLDELVVETMTKVVQVSTNNPPLDYSLTEGTSEPYSRDITLGSGSFTLSEPLLEFKSVPDSSAELYGMPSQLQSEQYTMSPTQTSICFVQCSSGVQPASSNSILIAPVEDTSKGDPNSAMW